MRTTIGAGVTLTNDFIVLNNYTTYHGIWSSGSQSVFCNIDAAFYVFRMQANVAFYYFTIYMYLRYYKNKIYYQDVRISNDKNQNIKPIRHQAANLIFFVILITISV
jgi:hypothetical protein